MTNISGDMMDGDEKTVDELDRAMKRSNQGD